MSVALKRYRAMAAQIRRAVSTPEGKVLLAWLEENCFMTKPSTMESIDSPGAQQRLNARRDLYIALQNILKEGVVYEPDSNDE